MHALLLPLCCLLSAPGDPDLLIRNEYIEVGVSKEFGGAITWLSLPGHGRNLINNHDKGRQVQQSIYAGNEIDRTAEGQRKNWSPWPWNPVQAGDSYGNKSKMIEARATETSIYTKVQPMLWDMDDELAEAYYETWIELEGPAVHVLNEVTCFRTDDRWPVVLRDQELPAAYTIGAFPRLWAYDGEAPWTNATLSTYEHCFPGKRCYATEKWMAYTGDDKWGVGVYNPDIDFILYMFSGKPPGETADAPTGYIAPIKQMALEKDSSFRYEYYLMAGTLEDIRQFVYVKEGKVDKKDFDPPLPPPPPAGAATPAADQAATSYSLGIVVLVLLAMVTGAAVWWRR